MNQGVLQSIVGVQQMMAAGSPNNNWWSVNNMRPPPSQPIPTPSSYLASPSPSPPTPPPPPPNNNLFPPHYSPPPPPPPPSTTTYLPSSSWDDHSQEFPESWGQLLLGGLVGEEGEENNNKSGLGINMQHQILDPAAVPPGGGAAMVGVKQEGSSLVHGYVYGGRSSVEFQARPTWPPSQQQQTTMMIPVSSSSSSPRSSCVTTLSSKGNMLDFSTRSEARPHPPPDHSSECNSTATGGVAKKARVHHPATATQSTFKVRKEKLGDRITALHQLVSPFGKTDTASVLLEALGYIRFLQSQIEALSLPYMGNASGNMRHHHHHHHQQQQQVQAGERNCLFPEDPGQLLNDKRMKKKATPDQEAHEPMKDLRSRGLCLVPVSCTLQVGSDNGADYWAPAFNGGLQ